MTSDLATQLTVTQSVAYSILSASETEADPSWKAWAEKWLKATDRTAASAQTATAAGSTASARNAATAASLLAEATDLQTEAALLAAEGRNATWQLDKLGDLENRCLAAVTEAVRLADVKDLARLLVTAEAEF